MKQLFPLSFKWSKDLVSMIIGIVIYLIVGAVAGLCIWLAGFIGGWIPVVGVIPCWVLRIVSILVDVYVVAGIVILVLVFLKIVK